MKFNIKHSIILLILTLTAISSTGTKGTQSVIDLFSDFFSPGNEDLTMAFHKKESENQFDDRKNYRFSQFTNTTAAPSGAAPSGAPPAGAAPATNPTGAAEKDNSLAYLKDWFMISSSTFKNRQYYEPVTYPGGRRAVIHTDMENFRINDGFFPNATKLDKPPSERHFYFRLSGLNLYYSTGEKDMNILQAIPIENIEDADHRPQRFFKSNVTNCFGIIDKDKNRYEVCSFVKELVHKWLCEIKKLLGRSPAECIDDKGLAPVKTVEVKVTQPIIIIPIPSKNCNDGWDYKSKGNDWECDCKDGKEQSPIDLPAKEKAIDSPVKALFQYLEVNKISDTTTLDGIQTQGTALRWGVYDNALRFFHHNLGKIVTLDGAVYQAQEVVFHTPAEHTIDGKHYDLEIQIVHYGQTVGDIAKQVILSFLFEKRPGSTNKFIDDFEPFDLPNQITRIKELNNNVSVNKIFYNQEDTDVFFYSLKPFSFYTYQGSMTSPPCTENTIVYVASKPMKIGTTMLALFTEALRIPDMRNDSGDIIVSPKTPISSRKTQPLNGRPVYHYNHEKYCGPEPPKPIKKIEGHYEQITQALKKIYYVSDNQPSGLPNSFVIDKKEATGSEK